MKRKLMSILLVMVMIIGYSTNSLIPTAKAIEIDDQIYQVTKVVNPKQNSVQIKLQVRDDIQVTDVILPDQSKIEQDLQEYSYNVDTNGDYQFILHYQQQDTKEEIINVHVTELQNTTIQTSKGLYVSSTGDDTSNGTKEAPFKTLHKAVEVAKEDDTIYLLNNITLDQAVRVVNKSLTIDGQGHTITRGEIAKVQDNARSTYNPAMFELNNWDGNTATHVLTFKNITLDDKAKTAGSIYKQQSTDKQYKNEDVVQDAIIACYTSNKIILDEGTTLQNYGGMSAVRLTSQALLEMKNGSTIKDTLDIERGHADKNNIGQIAAIWIQNGQLDMHSGSKITHMNGRAILVEEGNANVGGSITDINGRPKMWFGQEGIAIHLRGSSEEAKPTVTFSGHISKIKPQGEGGDTVVAIRNIESYFKSTQQSTITDIHNMPVLYAHHSKDDIGGTIENCSFNYLIRATYNDMTFASTALIQNNRCRGSVVQAVVYSTNGAKYTFNGQMINNDANYAFYIIQHNGKESQLIMNKGAKLSGTGKDTGVYINASGSKFTMNGGEITNFSNGVRCRGKKNNSATFIMNGGHIHHNKSNGIYAYGISNSNSLVQLNGGTIENNGNTEIYMSGGNATSKDEHLELNANILKGKGTIKLSPGTMTLDKNYHDIQVGNAKIDAVNQIKDLLANHDKYTNWSVVGSSAYWIKPSTSELSFKVSKPFSAKKTGLFVTYIPLNADGTPEKDAQLVKMQEVNNDEVIDIHLTGLKPHTAYAIMLVNNDIYTLNPDSVVKYTGGGRGQETSESGFPFYTFTDCLDDIKSLEINGKDTGLTGNEALFTLYDYLDITVVNEDGQEITNDVIPGDYIGKLSYKDPHTTIRINGNNVVLGKDGGSLIIRNTADKAGAISGETTYPLLKEAPTKYLTHPVAIAKKPAQFYINNDKDRKVMNTDGISLFADELLALDENDNRQELLENKAKDYLGIKNQLGHKTYFDFCYLDLVDAFNGNVWVSANNGTTVYLPYPGGTNQSTDFTLVHFKGLHREYDLKDQNDVINAVKECELETMNIKKTDVGIQFDVGSSGFSPFALVWGEDTGISNLKIQYLDKETNKPLLDEWTQDITVNDNYNVTDLTTKEIKGYHIDSIDGPIKGIMSPDNVIIKVMYMNDAPVIIAKDITIQKGDSFNPLNQVSANDYEDGDLTKNIKIITNTVDTSKVGTYEITYEVTDIGGKTTTLTRKVYVSNVTVPLPSDKEPNTPTLQTPVKTGDQTNATPYILIAGIALIVVGVIIYRKNKK